MTQIFTCTSNVPYDKHDYEVVLKTGKNKIFDHWEDAQRYWFENSRIPDFLDVIIVKDKKKVKSKGFTQ
jgi:hypothetical protein